LQHIIFSVMNEELLVLLLLFMLNSICISRLVVKT
jgi:hypothetical protein